MSRFQTSGGMVMGTLGYMSPEQARAPRATTASDMYSFGLVLQELFTGRHPYPTDLDAIALVERVRTGQTRSLSASRRASRRLIGRLTSLRTRTAPHRHRSRGTPPMDSRQAEAPFAYRGRGALPRRGAGLNEIHLRLPRERTAAVAARDDANRRREQAEGLIGFMLGDLRKKLEPVGPARFWTTSARRRWTTSTRCRRRG